MFITLVSTVALIWLLNRLLGGGGSAIFLPAQS